MADELLCAPADVLDAWPPFAFLSATRQASLVSRASQKVINHCRRPGFLQASVTEVLDGKNSPRLWLSRRPIITVSTITVNGTALDNSLGSAWSFNPKTGELRRGNGQDDVRFAAWFPAGRQNVSVLYWGGYVTVPDPVVEAVVWTVKWMADQAKISGIYASESIGDYSYQLRTGEGMPLALPTHIAALLADYVQDDAFA